jgi:transcriptional regulator with XRE-family HTH domain
VQPDLDIGQSEAVAAKVREELARRRVSRQRLAEQGKISISTLEKALSGRRPFTLATVVRIEEALGLKLRAPRQEAPGHNGAADLAPPEMGAYSRAAVSWLECDYLTLRPSFSDAGAVFAYRTRIEWDGEHGHLAFRESARIDSDFTQHGFVSFPHLSGHIYLVTVEQGQYRLAILGRPSAGGALHGVLTTLIAGEGAQLIPASAPIALVPIRAGTEAEFGLIRTGQTCFEEYRRRIERISNAGFARLLK